MGAVHTITLIEGDGIGPEVARAAVQAIAAAGVTVAWDQAPVGRAAMEQFGELLPHRTLDSIKRNKVALKGPITTPIGEGYPSINVGIRQKLDLFACVRPVQSLPSVPSRFENIDMVIVRENTEDLYAGKEHEIVPGVIESLKIITERASTRIAEFAFDFAVKHHRKKVTAVHKANIMKLSDGLFLACARKAATKYPQIQYNEMIVDNTCLQLVMDPHQFDVFVMPNLYGDIISDLAAGLVGGIGVVPGANIGSEYAVFEPVHGSWPSAAGKGVANPIAMVMTSVLMLEHIGEEQPAERLRQAVIAVLKEGRTLTGDLGGTASTSEVTQAIIHQIQS